VRRLVEPSLPLQRRGRGPTSAGVGRVVPAKPPSHLRTCGWLATLYCRVGVTPSARPWPD